MKIQLACCLNVMRILTSFVLLILVSTVFGAEEPQSISAKAWTPEEIERFLLRAKVVKTRSISQGITRSSRATVTDGRFTHDAHVQKVDVIKPTQVTPRGWELNLRDSYKFNIAAYRLNRMLELGMVPVSVERKVDGVTGSLTWWIDDVLMTEKSRYLSKTEPPDTATWNQQIRRVRVFDELIYNVDRNLGNLVITRDWKLWMIDHTRAFRRHEKLHNRKQLVKCDRKLLEAMRKLAYENLSRELKPYLTDSEIKAMLARRDLMVAYFDQEAAKLGEDAVLSRISNLIQTSRPSGGLERLYS